MPDFCRICHVRLPCDYLEMEAEIATLTASRDAHAAAALRLRAALEIAVGALMLVHSADSLRGKDWIALNGTQEAVSASGLPRGSFTPERARRALAPGHAGGPEPKEVTS